MTDIQQAGRPNRLNVERQVVDGIHVVTVRGEIDHDVKDALSKALVFKDGTVPPRIVVDLSGVPFMDSSGINVFVTLFQQVSDADGWLRIAGAQEPVLRILQLVGIDSLIPCHPTAEQALSA
ncbi:STAS domain-containing protein [Streptomyces bugieae]|uniref:Anti-sigma factor antagonist n=1 Tax=Streptomyces bugieae TaxID=3098223 RepID=A0ABU7NIW7_9ACTN|nr:STAS domain-containing protein [Streptomyces sp. DSM 41528]